MTSENVGKKAEAVSFLDELKDFALTVGEDCPEGHRKDPGSGRCLPMGGQDHTKYTRSINNDDGPQWRGEVDKTNTTFAAEKEVAVDADDMDEPQSCAAGTTFSFIQRKCVTLEDAESEDSDTFAIAEDGTPVFEDDAKNGHEEIVRTQPEGRRDPVNHDCPTGQFFDYLRRECIPLNKDSVLASEAVDAEFKKAVATYLSGRLGVTSPDPIDGHKHLVTVDLEGNGKSSVASIYNDGGSKYHSHDVKAYLVKDFSEDGYTSQHFGHVIPREMWEYEDHSADAVPAPVAVSSEAADNKEVAVPITSKQRKGLSESTFGVPGKRKFPLDTCGRVRNAMARFNQGKGLTLSEKATLRRKILARAKACGIEVKNFAKATTAAEFAAVVQELIRMETPKVETENSETAERMENYRAENAAPYKGPCPPGMVWDKMSKKCSKVRGFVEELANHSDIVKNQPEGRRDPVGFGCPSGSFFDFGDRKCVPLDPSKKTGTTTSKAGEEDSAQRDLSPNPEGKPAKLPQDCPAGTIWHKDREVCLPLDSRKKTASEEEEADFPDFIKKMMDKKKKKKAKSEEEEAQTTPNGPGKSGPGCPEGQFMNPVTKKCMPRKGAFKGKSGEETAGREGLTTEVPGKVKLPQDCPAGTIWDGTRRTCTPLDPSDKNRPSGGPGPMDPKNVASMSIAQLVQALDEILKEQGNKEKSRVAAKDLPNAAFPPSLISPTHRSLMHHTPSVTDPYDSASVDLARLRNALYRTSTVEGFSDKAVEDAIDHLLFHAREIVEARTAKKD